MQKTTRAKKNLFTANPLSRHQTSSHPAAFVFILLSQDTLPLTFVRPAGTNHQRTANDSTNEAANKGTGV